MLHSTIMAEIQVPIPKDMSEKVSEYLDFTPPPTFASMNGTTRRATEPVMTSYRMSWSSVSQRIGRTVKSPVNRGKIRSRSQPLHPTIPGIPDGEAAQPRGIPGSCSVKDIIDADVPATESRLGYPQFDSLEQYCIADHKSVSERLWSDEANRLHYFVQNPTSAVCFENRTYFTTGDEAGYKALSTLAERILTAISLCILDNECINVRYCRRLSSRSKLQKLIQQAQVAAEDEHGGELADSACEHEATERRREQDALFDLINYISVVLARLITQTGTGKFWQSTVLCALAKRVAKIKILLLDLPSNARVAAQNGESVLDQSRDSGSITATIIDEEEECEEALRIIDADTKDGLTSVDEAQVASYCVNQNKFRSGMSSALRAILMSLRCLNRSGLPTTTYEICGLAYETGFQGFKVCLNRSVLFHCWISN